MLGSQRCALVGATSLLRGRFRYEETGPFDRTHLRFFTRETLHELIGNVGLVVERRRSRSGPPPDAVGAISVGLRLVEPYSQWPDGSGDCSAISS